MTVADSIAQTSRMFCGTKCDDVVTLRTSISEETNAYTVQPSVQADVLLVRRMLRPGAWQLRSAWHRAELPATTAVSRATLATARTSRRQWW